jgi:hypothetical protein
MRLDIKLDGGTAGGQRVRSGVNAINTAAASPAGSRPRYRRQRVARAGGGDRLDLLAEGGMPAEHALEGLALEQEDVAVARRGGRAVPPGRRGPASAYLSVTVPGSVPASTVSMVSG